MTAARIVLVTLAAAGALAGCTIPDGYGGVSVGVGAGYDPYYGGGYYGGGYYGDPYYGWYDGYYYPGTGHYVWDRRGRRHAWSDAQRRHWHARRAAIRDRSELRENWSEYRRDGSDGRREGWRDRRGDGAAAPGARPDRREARPAPVARQAPATSASRPSPPARASAPPPGRPERPTVSRSVETPATSRRDD